jgi:hypothetical protein
VKALGSDARFESRRGGFEAKVILFAEIRFQLIHQRGISTHDENLVVNLSFKITERHPVFLEEPEEMLARNSPVLGTRNSVST